MNTHDEINIEDLINEDIKSIVNNGTKARRECALREYYSNPNYCKYCGKLIVPEKGKKVSATREKQFCNHACAATFNNKVRVDVKSGPTSILGMCSDDDFIKAYNNCDNYNQLGLSIGYSFVNSNIKNKIKLRMQSLDLEEYYQQDKLIIPTVTKGELINKRSNWQSWRSTIQKNARRVYRESNKPKYCMMCGYDKTYEVAHIKAVSEYDDDTLISEINDINNLIALCPNHHWEFDHGLLDLNECIM